MVGALRAERSAHKPVGLPRKSPRIWAGAVLTGFALRLSAKQWVETFITTARRMVVPTLVIVQVLGLGFLTRYAGTDAVIGLVFTGAGAA